MVIINSAIRISDAVSSSTITTKTFLHDVVDCQFEERMRFRYVIPLSVQSVRVSEDFEIRSED